jgi:hypothetical protein
MRSSTLPESTTGSHIPLYILQLDLLLCQVLYLSPELLESVEDLILGLHEEDPCVEFFDFQI